MCFSAEVSIITFLIGIIGAFLCIQLNTKVDKIIGYFYGFVALMQIIEYLLWMHQKWIIYLILSIYTIIIVPYSLQFIKSGDFNCTLKDDKQNSHLIWNWNGMNMSDFVYIIFTLSLALISIFGFPNLKYGILMAIITVVTFTSSIVLYPAKAIGALWCFYTIFIIFIYYLLRVTNILTIK